MNIDFDSLITVLGTSFEQAKTASIFGLLGEPSRTFLFPPAHKGFEYADHGLSFTFDQEANEIWSVSFAYDSAPIRAGKAKPYTGCLLNGLARGNSLEEVERKLQQPPLLVLDIEGKIKRRKFQVDDLLLDCYFDVQDSKLNSVAFYSIQLLQKMGLDVKQLTQNVSVS